MSFNREILRQMASYVDNVDLMDEHNPTIEGNVIANLFVNRIFPQFLPADRQEVDQFCLDFDRGRLEGLEFVDPYPITPEFRQLCIRTRAGMGYSRLERISTEDLKEWQRRLGYRER